MYVAVNTLLRSREDPTKIERIVWIDESNQDSFVVDINQNRYPTYKSVLEIVEGLQDGTYLIEETDSWLKIVDDHLLTKSEKKAWERAWQVVQWAIKDAHIPNIFVPTERTKLIQQASHLFNIAEITISKYVKRYFIRGMSKYAVLPDYANCGGGSKERKSDHGKKRGRRRKNDSIYNDMNVDDQVKLIFKKALDKYYYQKNRPSLRWTYEQMIKESYATEYRIDNGVKIPVIAEGTSIPSFGQFRYWFEIWRDTRKEVSLREGVKKYEQRYRPTLGTTKQDVIGPASLFLIDATIGDIYLTSSYDRTKIIGRPTIYLVCDAYSRLIVGMYVGLENASYSGAMMAMLSAFEKSKVDYCRRYGIEINEEDWPGGIPSAIMGDRGEMITDKISSAIERLNIVVKNTSSYRPDLKNVVEKQFDLLQSHIAPFLKGGIQSDFRERGGTDYRLHSTLTLDDYTKIVIKTVLFFNRQHYLKGYERDEMQIKQNVPSIPIRLWEFGMNHHSGILRHMASEVLMFNLMPQATGVVTHRGIRFNGMYYSSAIAIKDRWFVRARSKGVWQVDINYDPRNVSAIYLRLSRTEYDVCYLLESQAHYKDKSIDDIKFLMELEQRDQAGYVEKELGDRISLAAEIESIVKEASIKTRAEKTSESKTARLQGIRSNRDLEKHKNREQEIFLLGQNGDQNPNVRKDVEEDEVIDYSELHLLRKKQEEGLYGYDE